MNTTIETHLRSLYGEDGPLIRDRIEQMLRKHCALSPALAQRSQGTLPLDQSDALMIAYGDQVTTEGQRPLQCLAHFAEEHLQHVVSGIHILPFYPSSSDDGFSVVDYGAIAPELGTWEDVSRIGKRFKLMFDAVFNHASAQSDWFRRFLLGEARYREYFIVVEDEPDLSQVVRPRALPLLTSFETAWGTKQVWTTFSEDQVDLNLKNPNVLLELLEYLLLYVRHGARFIRLDAIAYLWKQIGTRCIHLPETHRIIQLMRAVVDEAAPGVLLITETNVPHAENVSYFGDGKNEAQLVYNFALPPLVLHAFLRGDASDLSRWAADLALPSPHVTFFNFLASHDGIGVNPVRGILHEREIGFLAETVLARGGFVSYKNNSDGSKSPYELNITYFDALCAPSAEEAMPIQISRFLAAQAIMLAMRGMPGIYFHSLFGSRNDRAAAERSGIARRINRQKLELESLRAELANPKSLRSQVFEGYRRLLAARKSTRAFHPSGAQEVVDLGPDVFALVRNSPDESEAVLCCHNVSGRTTRFSVRSVPKIQGKEWRNLLTDERGRFAPPDDIIELGPYEVLWIAYD